MEIRIPGTKRFILKGFELGTILSLVYTAFVSSQ